MKHDKKRHMITSMKNIVAQNMKHCKRVDPSPGFPGGPFKGGGIHPPPLKLATPPPPPQKNAYAVIII